MQCLEGGLLLDSLTSRVALPSPLHGQGIQPMLADSEHTRIELPAERWTTRRWQNGLTLLRLLLRLHLPSGIQGLASYLDPDGSFSISASTRISALQKTSGCNSELRC